MRQISSFPISLSKSNQIITTALAVLCSLAIIFAAGIVLKPRFPDLIFAYDYVTSQMLCDVTSVIQTNIESDEKWKEAGPSEYKKRLMSIDPNVRLRAIKAIEEKSDPQFIPQMIKLLNDDTALTGAKSSDTVHISNAAKGALIKLLRDNIVREPGNIAQLLPLFESGRNGSLPEKLGVIDILSALREPTAYPLLNYLIKNKADPQVQAKASAAMRLLTPDSVISPDYFLVSSRRVEFMYLLMVSVMIMGIAAIVWLLNGKGVKLAALCLLALVLNFGLGLLVYAELNRATLAQNSVRDALNTRDLMALRAMCYTDYTSYPGDSFFCQKLVQIGDIETFRALIALPNVEPDDLPYLKTNFEVRTRWIMARIVVLNLGRLSLDAILDAHDPAVDYALAETLDQLKIQDKQIASYLERLSQSEPERVRKTAEKALSQMKDRPVWPSM